MSSLLSASLVPEPTVRTIRTAVKLHGELPDVGTKQELARWIQQHMSPRTNGVAAANRYAVRDYARRDKHRRRKNKTEPKIVPFEGPKRWGTSSEKFIGIDSTEIIPPSVAIKFLMEEYADALWNAVIEDVNERIFMDEKIKIVEDMLVAAGVEDGEYREATVSDEQDDAAHTQDRAETLWNTVY